MAPLIDLLDDTLVSRLSQIITSSVGRHEYDYLMESEYTPYSEQIVMRMYATQCNITRLTFRRVDVELPEIIMLYSNVLKDPVHVLSVGLLKRYLITPLTAVIEKVPQQKSHKLSKFITLTDCIQAPPTGSSVQNTTILAKLLAISGHAASHYLEYVNTGAINYEHESERGHESLIDGLISDTPNDHVHDLL